MKYIVDTHSLIWYFAKDKRLTNKIKNLLQEAEQGKNEIIIPAIVLLETIDIQEKKKKNILTKDSKIKKFAKIIW